MKFVNFLATSLVYSFVTVSLVSASEAATEAPKPLTPQLQQERTLYRAITGPERSHVQAIYPVRQHPVWNSTGLGDFSHKGGLYVFVDPKMANWYGCDWAHSLPSSANRTWYLVTLTYKPVPGKKFDTKFFSTADPSWKNFILSVRGSKPPNTPIVEGPLSNGRYSNSSLAAFPSPLKGHEGELIWQGAFTNKDTLNTLTVKSVTPVNPPSGMSCNIL